MRRPQLTLAELPVGSTFERPLRRPGDKTTLKDCKKRGVMPSIRASSGYDIRQLPTELTRPAPDGRGFASYLKAKVVGVSRDMRVSSPTIAAAFIDGWRRVSVIDYGCAHERCTSRWRGRVTAAPDTASHNPGKYNGIDGEGSALPLSAKPESAKFET